MPTSSRLLCGCSSVGRAPPCQGGRREFESLRPLHFDGNPDTSVVSGFLVSIFRGLVRTKTALCENKDADHAEVSASRRTGRACLPRSFLLHGAARPNRSRALPLGDALPTPERTNLRPPEVLCCFLRPAALPSIRAPRLRCSTRPASHGSSFFYVV